MLVLNAEHVRRLLPVSAAKTVMAEAMTAHGRSQVHQPPRMVLQPPALDGLMMLKPAQVGGAAHGFGFKALTIFPGNRDRGLETIQGFVALLDEQTGALLAILEGSVVTEIRTAAVSAVATDVLARPDAGDLALIGAGVQARSHLLAMADVREVRRLRVWNRSAEQAASFRDWAGAQGFDAQVVPSVRDAVSGADIICTVTAAPEPLVDADWLAAGVHINAVGAYRPDMRELHTNVVQGADVIAVDSRESVLAEAGDLVIPLKEGVFSDPFQPPELGELLTGAAEGRTNGDEITVFESLGLAIQDVAAAAYIYDRARSEGVGAKIDLL